MWIGYVNIDQNVSACSNCLGVVQALFIAFHLIVHFAKVLPKYRHQL